MAAAQAHDFQRDIGARAKGTEAIHSDIRSVVAHYADDRPLGADIETLKSLIAGRMPAQ
jgi:histidine ammonia-lyase